MITLLKNSYGTDGVSIGTVFMGSTGIFKELLKSSDFRNLSSESQEAYLGSIFDHSIFMK